MSYVFVYIYINFNMHINVNTHMHSCMCITAYVYVLCHVILQTPYGIHVRWVSRKLMSTAPYRVHTGMIWHIYCRSARLHMAISVILGPFSVSLQ